MAHPHRRVSRDMHDLAESWRRPSGIYVVAPIEGSVAEVVREVQRKYDPKLTRLMEPHLTLVGSSGMGPIDGRTPVDEVRAALEPIAATTAPLELAVAAPMRFMQTDIVVLPLDPHGPLRTLHERIRASGLRYAQPRFTFTPHITLSFFRELTNESRRALLGVRVTEPVRIACIACSLTNDPNPPRTLLELPLTGGATGAE
jgi:2'-5' RNA ligase